MSIASSSIQEIWKIIVVKCPYLLYLIKKERVLSQVLEWFISSLPQPFFDHKQMPLISCSSFTIGWNKSLGHFSGREMEKKGTKSKSHKQDTSSLVYLEIIKGYDRKTVWRDKSLKSNHIPCFSKEQKNTYPPFILPRSYIKFSRHPLVT